MWLVGKGCAISVVGFALLIVGAFVARDHRAFVLVMGAGMVVLMYGLSRASAETVRELTIPFAGTQLPRAQVIAALERMGCVVSDASSESVTGFTAGWGEGQVVTVTHRTGGLRVVSRFPSTRAFGGEKNQENVERFRAEWARRSEFDAVAVDPAVRQAAERNAREAALRAIRGGVLAAALGAFALSLVLFAPARPGASPGGKYYLTGVGIMFLGLGASRILAARRRLRQPRPR